MSVLFNLPEELSRDIINEWLRNPFNNRVYGCLDTALTKAFKSAFVKLIDKLDAMPLTLSEEAWLSNRGKSFRTYNLDRRCSLPIDYSSIEKMATLVYSSKYHNTDAEEINKCINAVQLKIYSDQIMDVNSNILTKLISLSIFQFQSRAVEGLFAHIAGHCHLLTEFLFTSTYGSAAGLRDDSVALILSENPHLKKIRIDGYYNVNLLSHAPPGTVDIAFQGQCYAHSVVKALRANPHNFCYSCDSFLVRSHTGLVELALFDKVRMFPSEVMVLILGCPNVSLLKIGTKLPLSATEWSEAVAHLAPSLKVFHMFHNKPMPADNVKELLLNSTSIQELIIAGVPYSSVEIGSLFETSSYPLRKVNIDVASVSMTAVSSIVKACPCLESISVQRIGDGHESLKNCQLDVSSFTAVHAGVEIVGTMGPNKTKAEFGFLIKKLNLEPWEVALKSMEQCIVESGQQLTLKHIKHLLHCGTRIKVLTINDAPYLSRHLAECFVEGVQYQLTHVKLTVPRLSFSVVMTIVKASPLLESINIDYMEGGGASVLDCLLRVTYFSIIDVYAQVEGTIGSNNAKVVLKLSIKALNLEGWVDALKTVEQCTIDCNGNPLPVENVKHLLKYAIGMKELVIKDVHFASPKLIEVFRAEASYPVTKVTVDVSVLSITALTAIVKVCPHLEFIAAKYVERGTAVTNGALIQLLTTTYTPAGVKLKGSLDWAPEKRSNS